MYLYMLFDKRSSKLLDVPKKFLWLATGVRDLESDLRLSPRLSTDY